MGSLKERVEGLVLAYQHCMGCKRLLEEIEANWYSEKICQDIHFFDAGYQEHNRGRQVVQFHFWLATLGTVKVKKVSSA